MASFSQGFLNNLGRPAMTQSLFDLGSAIGQAPSQYRAKQQRASDAASLEGLTREQKLLKMAEMAARDGNMQRAAQLEVEASKVARSQVTQGREDETYSQKKLESESLWESRVSDTGFQLNRLQGLIESDKASPQDKAAATNLQRVIKQAGALGGEKYSPRVDQLLAEDYSHIVPVGGKWVLNKKTGEWSSAPGSTDPKPFDFKTAKDASTPESFIKAMQANDPKLLEPISKEDDEELGGVTRAAEKALYEMQQTASLASTAAFRSQELESQLLANKDYTSGLWSDIRTQVLGVVGSRDDTEEQKTAFLRSRNNEIINGLPPGVASDRDIQIFSAGLPPDNASREEVLAYLRGERKVGKMAVDIAVLASNHIKKQKLANKGDADLTGMEPLKAAYRDAVQIAVRNIESAPPEQRAAIAEEMAKELQKGLGFVPSVLSEYI
jgi:uncharacterized membrane protein